VWHLCRDRAAPGREVYAVLVSNATRACALWAQRAAPSPDAPVFWDYHVFLADRDGTGAPWRVWDLDTTLGLPVPFADYAAATFRLPRGPYAPRFRVIAAGDYVAGFASDRAHMRGPDGAWLQQPPPWPAIGAGAPNLAALIDLAAPSLGEVLSLAALRRRFGG